MDSPKRQNAVNFIHRIQTMDPDRLTEIIQAQAGEALARFFLEYSANLISRDPEHVLENTSSLMLMGYLIRAQEEKAVLEQRPDPSQLN